jgi:tetratricopeptide (TPR) repeat protein
LARSRRHQTSRGSRKRPAPELDAGVKTPDAASGQFSKTAILIAVTVVAVIILAGGMSWHLLTGGRRNVQSEGTASAPAALATFVGSETCAGCHFAQAQLWRSSHHKLAMDHATDKSVLGDFSDVSFEHFGVRSRFSRRDEKFLVETDGVDGKLGVFEIKYTFGVDPLQQYLVEFPDGRLQALSIAWDSRPKDSGGQRWFHLYPNDEIRHDDVLHWTKLNQNWNFMCAECHSTGVRKNYDAVNDRFATAWAEINVGCEACHGQGSRHVGWARDRQSWWPFGKTDDPTMGLAERFTERRDATWALNITTGNANRSSAPRPLRAEVETCGLCHARRGQFSEAWVPGRSLSETHMVSSLSRGLYHADGQMLDEVYNYGSFKQSKMFAAGVTCSDCHDPHSARPRLSGDSTCLQCHSPDKYAAVTHHRHEAVSPPLSCASCHMPTRTYMVVDRRHDHSFRVPRPDLSAKVGTPNACNDCHTDKSPEWAASALASWHGPNRKGFQNYAEAFHAAWSGRADAARLLAAVVADRSAPAIARASALSELRTRPSPSNLNLARAGLTDSDPMVRIGTLDMLEGVPDNQLWPLAAPLLSDPNRGVRIRAASLLAGASTAGRSATDRERFERAAGEFITAQRFNADRPEARATLGSFLARRGLLSDAETEYKAALRLNPQYAPAAINLADLYRGLGREADGESVLRAAVTAAPQDAGLHHALGLVLVRLKRLDEALGELRRASELDPNQARYAYVYAVGLHSAGRVGDAMTALKESLARHPDDRDMLLAIINFSQAAGDVGAALEYAEELARIGPTDPNLARLIENLRRQTK